MRDLIVTAVSPNVSTGRGVRTYGVTAALARDHAVEVAYVVFDWDHPAPEYEALDSVSTRALSASRGAARTLAYVAARLRGVPSGFARGVSPELAGAAKGVQDDVRVIADGPTVAAALLPLARSRPAIYLAHNLESSFRTEDGAQLKRFERSVLQTFSESWMPTRADQLGAAGLAGPDVQTRYVPNVVDLDRIDPVAPAGHDKIVFIGDFTYPPNRDGLSFLTEQVLPIAWQRRPALRLAVVGRGLTEKSDDPRVEVLGFVEDLRAAYASADAVAVPLLHGGGSPLKFIEALAYGLPVVATAHAAGLLEDAEPGKQFLSAASAAEFAEALELLLSDPARGVELAAAGRELVAARYSVAALAARLAS
jgi:glycosyltransferase involved in cell wall biosynthesis